MAKQVRHQEDLYSRSKRIRQQEITLQVIAGERTIEEIRTIIGIPGDGANNDMISVQMALELGCQIKSSKYLQYWSCIDGKPLEMLEY